MNPQEQITHITPAGNELLVDVAYDRAGPVIRKSYVVHRETGVMTPLDENVTAMFRTAMQASRLAGLATNDLQELQHRFGSLIEKHGENPGLAPFLKEATQVREFAELALKRQRELLEHVEAIADRVAENEIDRLMGQFHPTQQ